MTNLSSLTDSYGIYTFKDDLIFYKVENFGSWRHRELAVQKDWLLNAYINKLNEEIFTEKPIFTPDIFGGTSDQGEPGDEGENPLVGPDNTIEPKPEVAEQDVSDEWELERWDNLMLRLFNTSRTHSFSVVQLYNKAPWWRVYSEREIVNMKYDTNGSPIGCHVEWTLELPKSDGIFINFSEDLSFYNREKPEANQSAIFVPFGIRKGNRLGEFDIETLWPLSVDIRYIGLDITWNSAKTSGFLFLKYGDALKSGDSQTIVNVMDIIGSNRAIGAKKGALEDIVAIHPENCQFSIDALLSKLKLFASNARLPLTFFVGEKEQGGVFTEGFTDEAKINKKKKYIFGQFKPYIKDLVRMRWGIDIEDVECYIEEQETESFEFGEEDQDQNNKEKKDE